jgi:hypothetical protein
MPVTGDALVDLSDLNDLPWEIFVFLVITKLNQTGLVTGNW